jgi:hypothetical protein
MGHLNSNSKANHINTRGPTSPSWPNLLLSLSCETRPTSTRPSPASLFPFPSVERSPQATARPSQTRPSPRPFNFRPGQLTSGARLSAFPFPTSPLARSSASPPSLRDRGASPPPPFSPFPSAASPARSCHLPASLLACPRSTTRDRNRRASRVGHRAAPLRRDAATGPGPDAEILWSQPLPKP